MRFSLGFSLLGLVATLGSARAEFQVIPPLRGTIGYMRKGSGPIILSPPRSGMMRRPTLARAVPIASGFGRHVPLAFAVRQIVPAGVKTTFGPGVDQAAAVDWTGGGPWNEVLRSTVLPLGLRVTVGWAVVSITSGPG